MSQLVPVFSLHGIRIADSSSLIFSFPAVSRYVEVGRVTFEERRNLYQAPTGAWLIHSTYIFPDDDLEGVALPADRWEEVTPEEALALLVGQGNLLDHVLASGDDWVEPLLKPLDQEASGTNGEDAGVSVSERRNARHSSTPRSLEALLGADAREVLEIVRSGKSTDDRMRAICSLDRRFLGYTSNQWGDLLGVGDGAVRKTPFWQNDLPDLRKDDRCEVTTTEPKVRR